MYIIDETGMQQGNILVTATTNEQGEYNLLIPEDISNDSVLVVAVGGGANQMRAIVVSRNRQVKTRTDISPYSELVLDKIIDYGQPISAYSAAEIAALVDQVIADSSSMDLSGAATIEAALSALYTGAVATNLDRDLAIASGVYCGNGDVEEGEGCDDGNNVSGDGCSANCQVETIDPVCGNGVPETGEQCDAGTSNTNTPCVPGYDSSCDYCDTSCVSHTVAGGYCGDGITEDPEEGCDDGDAVSGDGCSESCQVETPSPVCGNGTTETGETCDDGNTVTEVCTYGQISCAVCNASCQLVAGATAYCGDSTVNGSEQCDAGGSNTNTPCVPGYDSSCSYCNLSCQTATVQGGYCGDGIINGTEQCDGVALGGATCTSRGFDGGTLSCSSCSFDTSACTTDPAWEPQLYVSEWTVAGNPRGVAYSAGRVYVADSVNARVIVYDESGNPITTLSPTGMEVENACISPDGGKIVITGGTSSTFALYTFSGGNYTEVGTFGSHGSSAVGEFYNVQQCVFDSDGVIVSLVDDTSVVGNETNHGFCQWNSVTQQFVGCTRGKGTTDGLFTRPYGITRDSSGNLYVGDSTGRIQKFSSSGSFVTYLMQVGGTPMSLAYLDEIIYVADYYQNKVNAFDLDGNPIGFVNDGGSVAGNLLDPIGVAIKSDGTLFVSEPLAITKKIKKYAFQ
ncbi:MAG TPA: hypothetical protein PKH33_14990 [bacterium]|nr:hypothetical protein [bacterium]